MKSITRKRTVRKRRGGQVVLAVVALMLVGAIFLPVLLR